MSTWATPLRLRPVKVDLLQQAIQGLWQPADPPLPLAVKPRSLQLIIPLLVLRDPDDWGQWFSRLNVGAPRWNIRKETTVRPWVLPQTHAVVYGRLVVLRYHHEFPNRERIKGLYRSLIEHWCHIYDDLWPLWDRFNPYHTRHFLCRWLTWWDTHSPWVDDLVCVCQTHTDKWQFPRCSVCHNRLKVKWRGVVSIETYEHKGNNTMDLTTWQPRRITSRWLRLVPAQLVPSTQLPARPLFGPGDQLEPRVQDWYYYGQIHQLLRRVVESWGSHITVSTLSYLARDHTWRGLLRNMSTRRPVICPRNHIHGAVLVVVVPRNIVVTCGVCVFSTWAYELQGYRPAYDVDEGFPRVNRVPQNIEVLLRAWCRRHPWQVQALPQHPTCCTWTLSDDAYTVLPPTREAQQGATHPWIEWGCRHTARRLCLEYKDCPTDVPQLSLEAFEPRGDFRRDSYYGFRFVVEWMGEEGVVNELAAALHVRGLPHHRTVYRAESHNVCRWVLPFALSYAECGRLTLVLARGVNVPFVDLYGISQRPRAITWSTYHPASMRPNPPVCTWIDRDTLKIDKNPRRKAQRLVMYWDKPRVVLDPRTTLHEVQWTLKGTQVQRDMLHRLMALFVHPVPPYFQVQWQNTDPVLLVPRRRRARSETD